MAARKAQLESDMAQLSAKQADEPGVAAEQARLNRDYEVLKDQYDKLLADREDVKLRSDVASKTDAIKFRVIDPPSDPRVPIAPNRPLLLALVLIVGIAGGIGAAFAKAQLQTTYATAAQPRPAACPCWDRSRKCSRPRKRRSGDRSWSGLRAEAGASRPVSCC